MSNPWMRRTLIALGALLLLAVAAVGILIATFDANRYKSVAIDWMKTEHQRTLAIDGPIELSVFPRLAVKVSGVRLSEQGRNDAFIAVEEAALDVQVMPLLGKRLVVDRISARGVHAAYLRGADGTRNIDDFVSKRGGEQGGGSGAGAGEDAGLALRFDVSAVRFDDLRLRVRDEVAKVAGELVLESFTSGRLAHGAKSPVTLRASLHLTQPQPLKLALDGRMTLALDLEKTAFDASELKLDVTGDADKVKALAASFDGALGWDGSAVRAGPLQVAIKTATVGATVLAPSTLAVQRALYSPKGERLELEALKLALAGRLGTDPFEAALDWPKLVVGTDTLEGSAFSGKVRLAGATTLVGNFRSAAPAGSFDALRLPGVVMTIEGGAGPRKIEGNLKTDLLLRVGKGSVALDALALRATLADPGLQPLQLSVRGSASADATAAQWKLDGALNENRFDSTGRASFDAAVPVINASARFDALDLNRVLAPDRPTAAAGAASPAAPADTPVQLDGLRAVNGRLDFTAGALAYRQYRVADAKVAATLADGLLRIERLTGRAWGGTVDASGSAQAGSQRVAVKLAASGVDVEALLKDVAGKDLLEGTGRVDAELTSRGATLGALRSALAGTAALQLRDGAIKGINLARTLRQAKAALSLKNDAVSQASGTEKTDFTALTASARIAGGVAKSDDLDVKSPFLRIGGAGLFDIGRGRIDYTARATVTGSTAGQGGAELEALRGVTVPVALSGPFDAIDWRIAWSQVAASVVEKQVKDRIAEELGARLGLGGKGGAASAPQGGETKPKDVLRETLKGLFR